MKKSEYLLLLEKYQITPNFWASQEYFDKAGLEERSEGEWIYIYDPKAKLTVFPPLNTRIKLDGEHPSGKRNDKIWSDFSNYYPREPYYQSEPLDLEYVYDPKSFLDMTGGQWAVFRKNSRKFPNRFENLYYGEVRVQHEQEINQLALEWIETHGLKNIQDAETFLNFIQFGQNRKILFHEQQVVGLNVWDDNWCRINYRCCISKSLPFLNEYLRLLFYTDLTIIEQNKLVNDGGVLDNPKLKTFKDKMNPINVRQVYSWKRN